MAHRDTSIQERRNFRTEEGFEGQHVPTDFSIPSCGIEDVDRALFALFDSTLKLEIETNANTKKVPILFASGERFAQVKKNHFRDVNGTLILPLVSIHRTSLDQKMDYGMGMGQDPGEIVVKTRLSAKDPSYQNLLNKLAIENQDNVADVSHFLNSSTDASPGTIASRRLNNATMPEHTGKHLRNDRLDNNIYEVITMPFPHFFTAKYKVTVWAQYVQHMNIILEQIMHGYTGQGNQFKITSPKGYWFVAFVDQNITSGDNFDDYNNKERVIKYEFEIEVPAYMIVPRHPGGKIQLRRFLSAPQISFDIYSGGVPATPQKKSDAGSGDPQDFVLDEVNILNVHGEPLVSDRYDPLYTRELVKNPFTGEDEVKLVRVKDRNQRKGETVVSARTFTRVDSITF